RLRKMRPERRAFSGRRESREYFHSRNRRQKSDRVLFRLYLQHSKHYTVLIHLYPRFPPGGPLPFESLIPSWRLRSGEKRRENWLILHARSALRCFRL